MAITTKKTLSAEDYLLRDLSQSMAANDPNSFVDVCWKHCQYMAGKVNEQAANERKQNGEDDPDADALDCLAQTWDELGRAMEKAQTMLDDMTF